MSAVARLRGLRLLIAISLVACSSDDKKKAKDAGADAAAKDDGGPARIPRRDAAVSANDPIPQCDRADPTSCPTGDTCDLVIRRAPTETQFTVYPGCVKTRPARALGDPCDSDLTKGELYTAPGVLDEVHTDPCGPGLICAPDRAIRGGSSCQPLCSSGAIGDSTIACTSPTALCLQASDYVEFCRESERCDAAKQTGCNPGEGCYVRPTSDAQRELAVCRPVPTAPIADGKVCAGFYDCSPGSLCLGPVRVPPNRWMDSDLVCRPVCSAPGSGSGDDAGTDEDGGVGRGQCPAKQSCVPFSASGLSLSDIPKPPYGQCEQ